MVGSWFVVTALTGLSPLDDFVQEGCLKCSVLNVKYCFRSIRDFVEVLVFRLANVRHANIDNNNTIRATGVNIDDIFGRYASMFSVTFG